MIKSDDRTKEQKKTHVWAVVAADGHGCGYWENDHGTPEGCAVLTAAAKALSENDVYKTHNGYLAFEYNK